MWTGSWCINFWVKMKKKTLWNLNLLSHKTSLWKISRTIFIAVYPSKHHPETSMCHDPHLNWGWGWRRETTKFSLSPPVEIFLLTVPRRCFFCGSFLLFMFCVCHAFFSVHCSIVVTCWERAHPLALLCAMFYSVFVTFPCGVLGRVWYLIVSISDLCLLTCF